MNGIFTVRSPMCSHIFILFYFFIHFYFYYFFARQ